MNILVSKKLQEQLSRSPDSIKQTLSKAVHLLHGVEPDSLGRDVVKLTDTEPELYALRAGFARYIFAFSNDAIVLLAVTTKDDSVKDAEIGYVDRFRLMPKEVQESELDSLIADTNHDLIDNEVVIGTMAETNASGWDVDHYEITAVDVGDDEIRADITWHATGDQDEDSAWYGTNMEGSATVVVDQRGKVEYTNVDAKIVHPDDPRDDE